MTTTGKLISEEAQALQVPRPTTAQLKPIVERQVVATPELPTRPQISAAEVRDNAKKAHEAFWNRQFKTSDGKYIWLVLFTHAGKTVERWFAHGSEFRSAAAKAAEIVSKVTGNQTTSYTCAVEGRQHKAEAAAQRRDEILSKRKLP